MLPLLLLLLEMINLQCQQQLQFMQIGYIVIHKARLLHCTVGRLARL